MNPNNCGICEKSGELFHVGENFKHQEEIQRIFDCPRYSDLCGPCEMRWRTMLALEQIARIMTQKELGPMNKPQFMQEK